MRVRIALLASALVLLATTSLACSQPTAPAATPAPTKAAEPAKAAEPTKPAAAPTAAAAATKAPAATTAAAPAKSVDYPKRSITMIIPWPAGGGVDIGARALQPSLEKELGVSVEIVNRAGAGSQVGLTELALAKPDGYTMGMVSLPTGIGIYLDPERKATFSAKSFIPIALQVWDPGSVGVKADSPYKTLKDFVDAAKANPEKVQCGMTGIMGDEHLIALRLEKMAGVKFAMPQFEGGPPAINATLGGHVDSVWEHVGVLAAQVRSDNLRLLGVMDDQRSRFFPDVPTFKEQGYELFTASSRGFIFPAGVQPEIVQAMEKAIEKAMKDPEFVKKMETLSLEVRYRGSAEFAQYWQKLETETGEAMKLAK